MKSFLLTLFLVTLALSSQNQADTDPDADSDDSDLHDLINDAIGLNLGEQNNDEVDLTNIR